MDVIIVWSLIEEDPTYMAIGSGKLHQMTSPAHNAISGASFKRHKLHCILAMCSPIPVVSQNPPRPFGVTCQSAGRLGRNSHSSPA